MSITSVFGKRVKYYRELNKLSQEGLAELCSLHRTYIGSIERGERNITLINAEKIANALNVKLCELFTERAANEY